MVGKPEVTRAEDISFPKPQPVTPLPDEDAIARAAQQKAVQRTTTQGRRSTRLAKRKPARQGREFAAMQTLG